MAGEIKVAARKASLNGGKIAGVDFMSQDISQDKSSARESHWAKTRNLTITILILWFIFSFVVHWFAEGLNTISFMGFPLGFYMVRDK